MIVTTDAILLHSRRYGDTSRIVVLYSRDLGKVSVVARGARKPKSPFGSALEPLSQCQATIYHRKNRDLHTNSSAECTVPGAWASSSYERLKSGRSLCELVLRTQADESPAPEVYDLLQGALADIRAAPEDHGFAAALRFRLRLADVMGFGLPVTPAPEGTAVKISLEDGLARSEAAEGIRIARSAYHHITGVLEHGLVDVGETDRLELDSFLSLYFSHHLDRRISSRVSETLR